MKFEDLEKTLLKFKSGEKSLLQTIQLIQIYENQNDVIDFKNRVIDDCDSRIAALEDIMRKLLKSEFSLQNHARFDFCHFCLNSIQYKFQFDEAGNVADEIKYIDHEPDCLIVEARAVLEGK